MYRAENFPTFKTWWRQMTTPRRRVRHALGKNMKRRPHRAAPIANALEEGQSFRLEGSLKPGLDSKYSINGSDFIIDDDSWIFGEIAYGAKATVEGVVSAAGERLAAKLIITK